ncbi:glycoside hydrolase family 78 protein [Akkermansiaceae bacterium]|nr:glycoside hydrolase family 78 protein [Akkermansiaceae bacterium]
MLPTYFPRLLRLIALLSLMSCTAFASNDIELNNLRCEYHNNPLGIDITSPRLSWISQSDNRGWKQSAYQILVASSQENLDQDRGDLWDSGKTQAGQSIQIPYAGKPLLSHGQCFWKVKVWDQNGAASPWSQTATWSMGLLNEADWQAQWIGHDKAVKITPNRDAELAGKGHKITITKALYGLKGDPKKQIDIKEKLQAHVDAGNLSLKVTNEFAGKDPAFEEKKVLEAQWLVEDWKSGIVVNENEICDLTIGRPKQYLPAPYLRKEFTVATGVKRAIVYATAQGVYELSLNGQRVSNDVFMPGWTDYKQRIYYTAYDVTDLLKEGPNAIGAILGDGWFRGNISCIGQNKYGNKLRLKAQLHIDYQNGQSEILATDSDWKASYGPILESDMQAGEVYDARLEMPGWSQAGFDQSSWSPIVTGASLKPLLQAYPGVPVRAVKELPAVKVSEPTPGTYVFDLGQNFSGWARLKVNGQAGDEVTMIFAEMLKDDGSAYTINLRSARAVDTYVLKGGGEEVWEPRFTFHGFRYVQVTGLKEKPTADTITGIVLYSDSPESSSFECSNPMVNKIQENIVWGQRSNYLEVPTDCPQRDERLGWTGDTQVFIRTGCYNQDVSEFFTKWMVDLMDTQNRQGLFGNQAPVFHGHGAAAWACAGIICPWTIYKVYGDTRMIETHYDAMVRYMDACGKDGLGGRKVHTWGDWLAPGGRPPTAFISAAYHAYTTSLMAEMAVALGKIDDATKYNKQFQDIRAHFQKTFVKPDGKIESELQTAYCMALSFDLLSAAQRKQAEAHLIARIKADNYHLSSGFLGIPILLPTLTDMGRSDIAYRIIQNTTFPSWGYSIEQGATTIWERWNSYSKDRGFGDVKMNSFNHYSLGACGEWMFRSMLGIETDGAGFKKITMKPELGEGITWAKGHYDSIHGRIGSDWKIENKTFHWNIIVPANTSATVYLPAMDAAAVTESGKVVSQADGVEFLRMEKDRAVYQVSAGSYSFVSPLLP